MGGYTVIHFQNDLKVVINFLMQYIFDVCINGFDFGIRHHKQDLVDQMHTPVVDHAAAVAYQGSDYRTFVMGFPFESIREETSRNVIMASILRFLTTDYTD
jgi:hypothetical protein